MEYRQLGGSGLYVPVLCLGTATFGGTNGFEGWGHTQVDEARRMINLCLDAGVNLFDTADAYSDGLSETILGKAVEGLRNKLLISTKATFNLNPERYGFFPLPPHRGLRSQSETAEYRSY